MLRIFFLLQWPRSLHVWLWEKERKFTEEEEEEEEELLKISYLRPSPVSRNLSRDDNDDDDHAKSLLAHRQRPMLALGKSWIRKKNLRGVSCKQAALLNRPLSAATFARSLALSLALLHRSKSAAHVHPAQQSFVSVPHCQALDTLHSSVRSML